MSSVHEFLYQLDITWRQVQDSAIGLRENKYVLDCSAGMDAIPMMSRPAISLYLEAELLNGDVVVWTLDVSHHDAGWAIHATVDCNGRRGPEEVIPDPFDLVGCEETELAAKIAEATTALLSTVNTIDLAVLAS